MMSHLTRGMLWMIVSTICAVLFLGAISGLVLLIDHSNISKEMMELVFSWTVIPTLIVIGTITLGLGLRYAGDNWY
jgi:hypothetical protein